MNAKYETIGKYKIYLDNIYYLTYAGGKRELTKEKEKEWGRTLLLPETLKIKEQRKLGMENNPNVVPLKGSELMMFIKELKFVPLFDVFFEHSHLLQLTNLVIFEAIKAKSYEMAMRQ